MQGVQQDPHKFLAGPHNTAALPQVAAAGTPPPLLPGRLGR